MEINNSKEELGYRHSLSVYAIEPSQTATQQGSWSADAASAAAEKVEGHEPVPIRLQTPRPVGESQVLTPVH